MDMMYNAFNWGEQNLAFAGDYKFATVGLLTRQNVHLTLNPTQFPQFNSDIVWEIQTSQDYLENMAKIRVGRRSWEVIQQYSSQVMPCSTLKYDSVITCTFWDN